MTAELIPGCTFLTITFTICSSTHHGLALLIVVLKSVALKTGSEQWTGRRAFGVASLPSTSSSAW